MSTRFLKKLFPASTNGSSIQWLSRITVVKDHWIVRTWNLSLVGYIGKKGRRLPVSRWFCVVQYIISNVIKSSKGEHIKWVNHEAKIQNIQFQEQHLSNHTSIMSIKIGYAIRKFMVATVSQIILHRSFGGSMSFLSHNRFIAWNTGTLTSFCPTLAPTKQGRR